MSATDTDRDKPTRLDRTILSAASVAVFGGLLATLDGTIVNVALDTLRRDLDTDIATVQWVTTAYLLALALALPLSGWLVDRYGAKTVYLSCLIGFVATSGLCALAPTIGVLIGFRVLQGLVGGVLAPMGQTIVGQLAGADRLGRVMGIVSIPTLLGPILGPTVGGLIVGNASWRWIFLINVPIGVVGALLAHRKLPASRPSGPPRRLDRAGLTLISPGLALTIYAITRIGQVGTVRDAAAVTTGTAGVVLLATFVVHSLRKGDQAVLNLRLFRDRSFAAGTGVSFLGRFASDGTLLILPLYLQQIRHLSPVQTGLLLAPQGVGALMGLPLAGRLTDRRGARNVAVVGGILTVAGTVPLVAVSAGSSFTLIAAVLVVRGFGASLGGLPPVAAAYRTLRREDVPVATTTLNVAQRIGSPVGTAVLAVVLAAQGTPSSPHTFGHTFAVAVAASALLTLTSLLLPGRQRNNSTPTPPEPTTRPEPVGGSRDGDQY